MSCDVAALPFHAHANYGTWSIDFASNHKEKEGLGYCTKGYFIIEKQLLCCVDL